MADFPAKVPAATPLHVHAALAGNQTFAASISGSASGLGAATTWVAKLVQYMPVTLPWDYPVNRVWWINGSTISSTNVDFGVYTPDGTRLYNTGTTAMVGASSVQYVAPSTTFVLPAGAYYLAWTCDNTTNRAATHVAAANGGRLAGILEETTGSFGLPATMTPVSFTRAWGYNVCGLTRTTTGF